MRSPANRRDARLIRRQLGDARAPVRAVGD